MTLPNFLICGARKSGTTSIWASLKTHSKVYMPNLKEPSFFTSSNIQGSSFHKGIEWYKTLFQEVTTETAIGEASTSYLHDIDSPKLIFNTLNNPKLIVILRNPIDRSYSDYWEYVKNGTINTSFDHFFKSKNKHYHTIINAGKYATQLKRYYDLFNKKSILVLKFEELSKSPSSIYNKIFSHLNIKAEELPINQKHNPAAIPRSKFIDKYIVRNEKVLDLGKKIIPQKLHDQARGLLNKVYFNNQKQIVKPEFSKKIRTSLLEVYLPEIEEVESLLNWDLNNWKEI